MATKLLQEVFDQACGLPDETQDAIARRMQDELEQARFDALLESPESVRYLESVRAEIAAAERAGGLEPGGFDGR
jgi:hypothetical protein